jgi:uncharacterized protein YjbI with pentapeptide repeats
MFTLVFVTAIACAQLGAAEPPPTTDLNGAGKETNDSLNALQHAIETNRGGASANLKDINADGVEVNDQSDFLLSDADLTGAQLRKAKLTGSTKAFFKTKFDRADLTEAKLTGDAAFQQASFTHARLADAVLNGGVSGFQMAKFDDATLLGARLNGGGSSFQGASFARANLTGAILKGEGAALQLVNLDDANCTKLQIRCASALAAFQVASLNNTRFAAADLSSLAQQSLRSCVFKPDTPPTYDDRTKFPAGFNPAKQGWRKAH